MKKKLAIRAMVMFVVLGALAGLGVASDTFDFGLTSGEGETASPPEEDKVMKGKLAAGDLNSDGETGWSELKSGPPVTEDDKRKPRLSADAPFFTAQFVCEKSDKTTELVNFAPVHAEARTLRAAFRRKDAPDKANRAKGGSKLVSQRLAEYQNDAGSGGLSGAEKAKAVLDQIRGIVSNPDCVSLQLKTKDPVSTANPSGAERVWTVVRQSDPDLGDVPGGDGKKNAVHFRAISKIAGPPDPNLSPAEPSDVTIENDMVMVRRGRVLIVMTETSPGGHPNAADEAKGRADKADKKMHGSLS